MTAIYRASISVHPRTIEGELHNESYNLNVQTNDLQEHRTNLVMLHGYMGSVDDYNPAFERLGDKYNLIAIDLRGHGLSQVPLAQEVSWMMQDVSQDILQAIRSILGNETKYHLVASSMSTAVALEIAKIDQENASTLFLVSPTNKFQIPSWSGLVLNMSKITQIKLIESMIDVIITVLGRLMGETELVEDGFDRFSHIDVDIHKKIVQETLKKWEASTEEIKQPVLILAGLKDKIVPYDDTLGLLENLGHASILSFSDGEHHLIRRKTAIVFDLLSQWIEDHPRILRHKLYNDENILLSDKYELDIENEIFSKSPSEVEV